MKLKKIKKKICYVLCYKAAFSKFIQEKLKS